jgi:hypothetical protein
LAAADSASARAAPNALLRTKAATPPSNTAPRLLIRIFATIAAHAGIDFIGRSLFDLSGWVDCAGALKLYHMRRRRDGKMGLLCRRFNMLGGESLEKFIRCVCTSRRAM